MPPLKPAVFIPGYPATELWYAPDRWRIFPPSLADLANPARKQRLIDLLAGAAAEPSGSVVPGDPIRDVLGIAKQAASLYAIVQSNFGYDTSEGSANFAHVGWDWRKGIDDPATSQAVIDAIDRLSDANGGARVVVIVHSTGGLVFRSVIESRPEVVDRIDEVLAFGVPWAGTLKALHAIAAGDSEGLLFWRISAAEGRWIASRTQAAYDLVPPDPSRTDMRDSDGTPLNLVVRNARPAGALVDTSWMQDPSMLPLAKKADERLGSRTPQIELSGGRQVPPITNVVAWGAETLAQCDINADGSLTFSSSPLKLGDGTVPLLSASWLRGANVRTMFLPIGAYPTAGIPFTHARIWDSPPVLQLLDEVLRGPRRSAFVCAAADGDDAVDPSHDVRVRISTAKSDGTPLPQCIATVKTGSSRIQAAFNAAVHADLIVPRVGLTPNAANDLCRFEIEMRWTGGKTTLPIVVHT